MAEPDADHAPLRLHAISKRWRAVPGPVLDGVALTLDPGTATFFDGRNGVGKTTLMRVAAGLIRPDAGTVRIGELDSEADKHRFRRRVGFLSAGSSSLYARLTVAEHLDFWAGVALQPRRTRGEARQRVVAALELEPLLDRRVDRLSMGQRQRARLAGTLLHDPAVLLLDEPANSLDSDAIALLAAQVEAARGRGASVLWCAPKGEREPLAFDRRLRLADGKLVEA